MATRTPARPVVGRSQCTWRLRAGTLEAGEDAAQGEDAAMVWLQRDEWCAVAPSRGSVRAICLSLCVCVQLSWSR